MHSRVPADGTTPSAAPPEGSVRAGARPERRTAGAHDEAVSA
ncbi:hypothetical protein ACFVU3_19835 [Streptomyces sp. NPDC058052]